MATDGIYVEGDVIIMELLREGARQGFTVKRLIDGGGMLTSSLACPAIPSQCVCRLPPPHVVFGLGILLCSYVFLVYARHFLPGWDHSPPGALQHTDGLGAGSAAGTTQFS